MSEEIKVSTNPSEFHAQLQALATETPTETITNESTNEAQEIQEESNSGKVHINGQDSEAEASTGDSTSEQDADDTNTPQEAKKENKYVPRSRLKQETEKREALENQLMKEREDRIRYETQLQMIQNAQATQQAQNSVPELDLDRVDPLDAETHGVVSKEIRQLKEEIAKMKMENDAQLEYSKYYNTATAQEAIFEKSNPDYQEALRHLANVEIEDALEDYGDKVDYKKIAREKMENKIKKAIDNKKIAPEVLYNAAIRKGFKPKGSSNAAPTKNSGSNIDSINANMKKSASIGSLGSGAGMSSNVHSFDAAKLLRDPNNKGSGFDPKKFHEALHKKAN